MKIAFVTDSGCGKTIEELQQDGIYSVPLQVSYDNKNFQDLVDLSIDDVYKLMEEGRRLAQELCEVTVRSFVSRPCDDVHGTLAVLRCKGWRMRDPVVELLDDDRYVQEVPFADSVSCSNPLYCPSR